MDDTGDASGSGSAVETVVDLAESLLAEADRTNERRALVLAGDRERGYDVLESVLDALPIGISDTTLLGPEDRLRCEHLPQANAGKLLGTTRRAAIVDAHEGLRPNALGSVVGAVDGGGLLILVTPDLERWPTERDAFDESLAVPPFSLSDVTGRFRRRLVETLRAHRGIAIANVERDPVRIERQGLAYPAPRLPRAPLEPPTDADFPRAAYEACLTADQLEAVAAFEGLSIEVEAQRRDADADAGPPAKRALVLEADRGRGKSSAAGLAAGCLALEGADVLVTAPTFQNAEELFARARELLEGFGELVATEERNGALETTRGGRIRYLEPSAAGEAVDRADVVIVDEAAALPVSVLEKYLAADRVAFATTIHGYEGAGRGFSVRFRDRLEEGDHAVTDVSMLEPIRYAAGDPIEVWAFRALGLDARPPVDPLVEDADPESVAYRRLEPADLLADENLLRETFGLLVLAHYRTEPNDLARLLDAPNLETRVLLHDGHVVSVALLAREGGLSSETRASMYEGGRIRGNMLPDVLTSQLRDEAAGAPVGIRIVRIATHHAARSRGLGSRLLERVREEFESEVDWLGTGFGATPDLLAFWDRNGYGTIHVSTTRNDASGEYSAIMLSPTSDAGRDLRDRHAAWFGRRFPALCTDALSDLEPDVARAVLRSVDATPPLELSDHEWRVVAGAAYGPGLFDVDPGPFRRLVVRFLVERPDEIDLGDREERLLVLRALQGRKWSGVARRLEYHSAGQCMRSFGEALCPLVDYYGVDAGSKAALEVRERFSRDDR
ncbi:tRNA(Met) cytidine acetyltransferase TmcA [Natrialbaceae archaeon GCM10025810]|uniref:tRNA(Met) cytidine acetyltransferase TmcA n=1 Tax=Halovalidus salilacus TaxID=3075124 RepID=UPI00360BCB9E